MIQNINSTNCGLYCVAYLYYVNKKSNIYELSNDFINLFEPDTTENDEILKFYLNKDLKVFTKSDNKYLKNDEKLISNYHTFFKL